MANSRHYFPRLIGSLISMVPFIFVSCSDKAGDLPDWAIGEFVRPAVGNPDLSPETAAVFDCPMQKGQVHWMDSDHFHPAATD